MRTWADEPRYVPVLCPAEHRDAVEAYIADLEALDAEIDGGRHSLNNGGRSPSRSR